LITDVVAIWDNRATSGKLTMKQPSNIVGYRAIRRIATGELITAPAPVYAEDWPYRNIAPNQALFRYMDLWKFDDLFKTQELYFCRVDQYAKKDDPLEGALSPFGVHGTSASDVAFEVTSRTQEAFEKKVTYRETAKGCTFINCWHINDRESQQMWDKYTESSDSVVVITSAERLAASFRNPIFGSAVKYVDLNTPRTEFDERSLFFYKDVAFKFEQEFRLLVDLMDLGGSITPDHPDDFFRRIPIDLSKLVCDVRPHPQATQETKDKIGRLVAKHLP